MRPLAVLNALVFGSAAAISFGLTTTTIVFLVLKGEQPQLARELPALIRSCLSFLALSLVSGGCLYATLKELAWQRTAQVATCFGVGLLVFAYWPQ